MQFMKMQINCIFDTKWLHSYTNDYYLIVKPTFGDISLQKNCISTINNCFCKDICHYLKRGLDLSTEVVKGL